jgi:hypothetical protein
MAVLGAIVARLCLELREVSCFVICAYLGTYLRT